jgi:glycerate kinase
MADGGEGTLDIVAELTAGQRVTRQVCGPFRGWEIDAPFLFWPERREALVEMAVCAGLPLLKDSERDPLRSTTFGVGELVRAAAQSGAKKISLAVGGSATVDGGAGLAQALGWRLLDSDGQPIPPGGGGLEKLERILPPEENDLSGIEVEVWCDVTNPLLGPKGAAAVFGPQKGASDADVTRLEVGLARLAAVVKRDVGVEIAEMAGGGAAGGLAAGAVAFLGARLVPGVEALMRLTGLEDRMRDADWVVTGEGRFDRQSLDGKVVSGICSLAEKTGARVAVLAGSVAVEASEWRRAGIHAVEAANAEGLPLEEAIQKAEQLAGRAAMRLGKKISGQQGSENLRPAVGGQDALEA